MGGYLYIDNLTYDENKMLGELGAEIGDSIYHSDKDYNGNKDKLLSRLGNAATNDRTSLPAHAYITFDKGNMKVFGAPDDAMKIEKARLSKFLAKCKRPLGVVSKAACVANWPTNGWTLTEDAPFAPFVAMQQALINAQVIVEYYLYDGKPLLTVYPEPPQGSGASSRWKYAPE